MKKFIQAKYLFSSFLLLLFIKNTLSLKADTISPPIFSKESGFYSENFELMLFSFNPVAQIYFTRDGSDPLNSETAVLYTTPIIINDHSNDPNIYSEYQADDTAQSICRGNSFKKPEYKVDKALVIRAVAKVDEEVSEVVSETYFVTTDVLKKYKDLTVISLVTNPKNLFDPDIGIYVVGNQFFEWKNSDDYDPKKNVYDTDNKCNYFSKGKDWERPAKITIYNKGEVILKQNVGIRLKGSSTRNNPGKSFDIIPGEEYGEAVIESDKLLPNNINKFGQVISKYNSFSIRSVYEEGRLRDTYGQKIIHERENLDTQEMREAILFLDGEYWGLYEIMEKLDKYFVQNHYNISLDKIVIIKENKLEDGNQKYVDEYLKMCEKFAEKDLSKTENYEEVCKEFDIDSLIEHYVAGIYLGTSDWPTRNSGLWKYVGDKKELKTKYEDGKWRFITYDLDYTMGKALGKGGADYDNFLHVEKKKNVAPSNLFLALIKNKDFQKKFTNVICDYANEVMKYSTINQMFNDYRNELIDLAANSQVRWWGWQGNITQGFLHYRDVFERSITGNKNFFKDRPNYIFKHMENYFSLTGELKEITFSVKGRGYIKVNSIYPKLSAGKWKGKYYDNIPITIEAIPYESYRFKGWSKGVNSTNQTSILTKYLKETDEIEASFESIYNEETITLSPPEFSKDSGFYDEEFELKLSSKEDNISIYYTIDGSNPLYSKTKIKYTEPIKIFDRSNETNVYCTYIENDNSPQSISRGNNFRAPSYLVDKAMIIRAVVQRDLDNVSLIIDKTYFITNGNLAEYKNMTIISIITSPENLFDPEIGIYVTGNQFQEWKNSLEFNPNKNPWDTDNKCNYFGEGKKWEREASISFFNKGKLFIHKKIGMSLKGASTRNNAGKSFIIKSKEDNFASKLIIPENLDKNGEIIDKYSNLGLRCVYEEGRLRDRFAQETLKNRELSSQIMNDAILFLDGEYWGFYQIMEKFDAEYFENHYGVSKKDVSVIKENDLKDGREEDLEEYLDFMDEYSKKDLTDDNNYKKVEEYIDFNSLIEHYAAGIYLGTADWPNQNAGVWRYNGEYDEDNIYTDGKWRLMTYDLDYTMGSAWRFGYVKSYAFDHFGYIERRRNKEPTNIFLALLKNEKFKKKFANVFCDYSNEVMKISKISKMIDDYARNRADLVAYSQLRWWGGSSRKSGYERWRNNYLNTILPGIRDFFAQRPNFVLEHMQDYLGLSGKFHKLTIIFNGKGKIKVNSVVISEENGRWEGKYLDSVPIEITAINEGNNVFNEWKGDINSKYRKLVINVDKPMKIIVNFGE